MRNSLLAQNTNIRSWWAQTMQINKGKKFKDTHHI